MIEVMQISDQLSVGLGHPARDDLEHIAADGYRAVVNLRSADEEEQPLLPDQEGEVVRALGMAYSHFPVRPETISTDRVDAFRREIEALNGPVFIHCASGKRSGAFTMMHLASESGLSGEQTLEQARSMGFECENPELEKFVKHYVNRQHP